MVDVRSLLRSWLPVLAWMILIFAGSSDTLSGQRTSRIIGPILRWINPNIPQSTVDRIQLGVRKVAHLTEYAVLGALALRGLRGRRASKISIGKLCLWAWLVCVVYASSDEWHQRFVPNRQASVWDVLIDSVGAGVGLCLFAWLTNRPPREPRGATIAGSPGD